jgi:O-antigen/teichoic acid export membrane protein
MMGLRALVGRQMFANSVNTLVVRGSIVGLRLLIIFFVARVTEPATFGFVALCMSLSEIGRILSDFGVDALSVRDYAIADSDATRSHIAARTAKSKALLGVLVLVVLSAYLMMYYPDRAIVVGLLVIVTGVVSLWGSWSTSFFQAQQEMQTLLMPAIFSSLAIAATTVVLVAFSAPYWWLLALMPLHELVNGAIFARKFSQTLPKTVSSTPWRSVGNMLQRSLPIAVTSFISTLYGRLDVLVLGWLATREAVGHYGLAARLTEPLVFVAGAFAVSSYGHLSVALSGVDVTSRSAMTRKTVIGFGLGGITSAIATAAGVFVLIWKFLPQFQGALPAAVVFSLSLVFRMLNFGLGSVANASGAYHFATLTTTVSLICVVSMSWFLVPHYQAVGAAIALVACEFLNSLLLFILLRRVIFGVGRDVQPIRV